MIMLKNVSLSRYQRVKLSMGKVLVISVVTFMVGMICPALLLGNSISDNLSDSSFPPLLIAIIEVV